MILPYVASGDNVLDSISLIQQPLWFQSSTLSNHQGGENDCIYDVLASCSQEEAI